MAQLDFDDFDVLPHRYGTLSTGRPGCSPRSGTAGGARCRGADAGLEAFARHEAELEASQTAATGTFSAALTAMLTSARFLPDEVARLGVVAAWSAFPDSAVADAKRHLLFKLGVITYSGYGLFAASEARLGMDFDWVVTAQQAKRYKPNPRGFELAFERIGLPPSRILHVAQSLFHDHVTAKRLGLSTVWVDRRGDQPGSGATPPADATPDLTVPDMATLAALAVPA
jgi:2-haloacid dehalogenase